MIWERTVPILAYHRIGEPAGDHVPTVTPESFERQLVWMAKRHYRVIGLEEVVEKLRRGAPIPPRHLAMIFDDGYEETATIAAPLLRRFEFPATVFVTPNEIGLPGFMTWEQVRAIGHEGIAIGSHTLHHTYLPLASEEAVELELVESKRVLEQELGQTVDWLSYPVGGYTPQAQAVAEAAGYRAACTTNRGVRRRNDDLFALRRIKMTERDQYPLSLWVKLSGYYNLFRRFEHPY